MKIECRAASIEQLDEKTFTARAVPYDEETELWEDVFERFEPGALEPDSLGIKLRLEHETTIGVITNFENRQDGAYITAKISDTTAGRDAYTLLKDGVLRSVSVGFMPDRDSMQIVEEKERMTFVHSRATLIEVSLVSFPAYKGAEVTDFRSLTKIEKEKEDNMTTNDLTLIRSTLEDHSRSLASITDKLESFPGEDISPFTEFRSFGEYVKAYSRGEDVAKRAFDGATSKELGGSNRPAWVDRTLSQMVEKMRVTNLFEHTYDLPASGMSVEFPVFGEDSLQVTKQVNSDGEPTEGEELPFGKITFSSGSAPVITYGGASKVTRQLIERSSISYLDKAFARMGLHYAKTIEAATRSLLNESVKTREETKSIAIKQSTVGDTTVNDWIDAILEAAEYYDGQDFPLSGLLVNKEMFKHLAKLDENPKALKFTHTTDKTQGEISVNTLSGSFDSLPVIMVPMEKPAAFYTRSALCIQEAPGAPFRLQQEDISNLSNEFAVYGYAAHYAPDLSALAPVKVSAL